MPKRGDVVLIPFPFSDLTGQKIRPALILSNNSMSHDVVVVFITSKHKTNKSSFILEIEPTKQNGLKTDSTIICDKIATLDKKIILGAIGTLEKMAQVKVDIILKQVLGL